MSSIWFVLVGALAILSGPGTVLAEIEDSGDIQWQKIALEQQLKTLQLEAKVRDLEDKLDLLINYSNGQLTEILPTNDVSPKIAYRTCLEIYSFDTSSTSGYYEIDPDGTGDEPPFMAYCNMTTRSTSVSHDSETPTRINACPTAGCYQRNVTYNATARQMEILAVLSNTCQQYIKFNCLGIPFEFNNVAFAWWNDRNGQQQRYWAGPNTDEHTCQCGIDGDCLYDGVKCYCDALSPEVAVDEGYITDKAALPISRLNFGRSSSPSSLGVHTLGKFECSGRPVLEGPPKSCEDLWQIGYNLNGIYTVVDDTQVRTVYCDFTKLPGEEGQEKDISCQLATECTRYSVFKH